MKLASSYRHTLDLVRRSYPPEKATAEATDDLPSFWIYRPLSFWVTPFFMALRMTADSVTVFGIVLSAIMPIAAAFGGEHAAAIVIALALFIQVLDSVDGNIARTTGHKTAVGPMLDGLATILFWAFYFTSVGFVAKHEAGGLLEGRGLECGLVLAALLLAQREMEDTYDNIFGERVRWQPPVPSALSKANAPPIDLSKAGRVLEHVVAFGVFGVAAIFHRVGIFLACVAAYQITLLLLWLVRFTLAVKERARR